MRGKSSCEQETSGFLSHALSLAGVHVLLFPCITSITGATIAIEILDESLVECRQPIGGPY